MFIAPLFIMARTWKQTEEQIKKMWNIYTIKYYTVIKINDILKFAGNWMDLGKKSKLNELTQKDIYNMYSLISDFQT